MPDYIFKTYIDSGREYYEYTDAADRGQTIKRLSVSGSLMKYLLWISGSWSPSPGEWTKALLAFQSSAKG